VIEGTHFASLDGTPQVIPETRGDNFVQISDMTIDGNKANNSAGWGIRIWGHTLRFHDLTIQNCASGGRFTEYSDGSGNGGVYFVSNPQLGDPTSYFFHNKSFTNSGNDITFEGPNDSNFDGEEFSGSTGWALSTATSLLTATVTTAGTAVTATAGNFSGLTANGWCTIAGVAYQILSVADSTHLTLKSSAGSHTGQAFQVIYYVGTIDSAVNLACYGLGTGCYNFGAGAGIQAMVNSNATLAPICITEDATDGNAMFTGMTVAGCTTSGVTLRGTGNSFQGIVNNNLVGMILNGNQMMIQVTGGGNTTALNVIGLSESFIYANFVVPGGGALLAGGSNIANSTFAVLKINGTALPEVISIPGIIVPQMSGQLFAEIPNPSTPSCYVYSYNDGTNGNLDTSCGFLLVNGISKSAWMLGGGDIQSYLNANNGNSLTLGTAGGGQTQVPSCSAGLESRKYWVVDLVSAITPGAATGGGAQKGWITCNGSANQVF
jgi:hypothetical protein